MMLHKEGSEKVGEGIALAFVDKMVNLWLVIGLFHATPELDASQKRQDSSNYT